MNSLEKIYLVTLALKDAALLTSRDKPLLLHYQSKYVNAISEQDFVQILSKFADEGLIKIIRVPLWVNESMPIIYGLAEIEGSFEIELLALFHDYAEKQAADFKSFIFDEEINRLKPIQSSKTPKDSLMARERASLLKLLLGMAMEGYRYDPKKERNESVGDIHKDLERIGLQMDQQTILKYLKEAADAFLESEESH